jgi:Spy/CpxP family protein refolding chaperone
MTSRLMRMTTMVAGMLIVTGIMAVQADQTSDKEQGKGDRHGRGSDRGQNIERMMEQLNLTQEQKDQLKPLFEQFRKDVKSIRDNASLEPAARQAKFQELRKAHQEKVDAILTAEQKDKLNKLREEVRARHEERRAKKGPRGDKAPPAQQPE